MAKRVLIADDSVTIQKAFAMVFAGQDVELLAVRTLDGALTRAREHRPDLVIADVGLGDRTGYELCAAIKADAGLRGVPVYILASNHVPFDEARGGQAGADGFFLKPFDSAQIIDRVLDAMARPAAAPVETTRSPTMMPVARPAVSDTTDRMPAAQDDEIALDDDDDYGEFVVERSGAAPLPPAPLPARPAPAPAPAPAPVARAAPPAASSPGGGLRPSLIPGTAPAMAPPRAPAAPQFQTPRVPVVAMPVAPESVAQPAVLGRMTGSRTIMGLPAVVAPVIAGTPGMPPRVEARVPVSAYAPPSAPVPVAPVAKAPSWPEVIAVPVAPVPAPAPVVVAAPAPMVAAVHSALDRKIAEIAARGPEYEAIAKLSREIIEQVVWEVVPELAEVMVRAHVEKLATAGK